MTKKKAVERSSAPDYPRKHSAAAEGGRNEKLALIQEKIQVKNKDVFQLACRLYPIPVLNTSDCSWEGGGGGGHTCGNAAGHYHNHFFFCSLSRKRLWNCMQLLTVSRRPVRVAHVRGSIAAAPALTRLKGRRRSRRGKKKKKDQTQSKP